MLWIWSELATTNTEALVYEHIFKLQLGKKSPHYLLRDEDILLWLLRYESCFKLLALRKYKTSFRNPLRTDKILNELFLLP